MEALTALLQHYGYWLLLAVGFAEYGGVPIASMPVLIVAGAVTVDGTLNPVGVVLSAAAGGLLADFAWYQISRWRGQRLVDRVCGLTSNPKACVMKVEMRLEKLGPLYILPSKFLPGTGNLIAAAAGFAGVSAAVFLVTDAAALLLWAGAYSELGRLFAGQVGAVLEVATHWSQRLLLGGVGLVVVAGGWRIARIRGHGALHLRRRAGAGPTPSTSE